MEGVWGSRGIAPYILRQLYLQEITPVHIAQEAGRGATGREESFIPATHILRTERVLELMNISTPYFSLASH